MRSDKGELGSSRRAVVGGIAGLFGVSTAGCTESIEDMIEDLEDIDTENEEDNGDNGDDDPEEVEEEEDDSDAQELRWLAHDQDGDVDLQVKYQPIFDALENEFDIEVSVEPAQGQFELLEELEAAGEDDFVIADISALAVTVMSDEIDIVGVRKHAGTIGTVSTLATRFESPIEAPTDLEGMSIITNTMQSVSGGLGPLWILDQHGLDIGVAVHGGDAQDFNHASVGEDETAISELLQNEEYAAVGVDGRSLDGRLSEQNLNAFEEFAEVSTVQPADDPADADLKLIGTTPLLPWSPIVVNADWNSELRNDVVAFLLQMENPDLQHDAFQLAEELSLNLPDNMLADYNEANGTASNDFDEEDYDLTGEQLEDWERFTDHTIGFTRLVDHDQSIYQPLTELCDDLGIDPLEIAGAR